MSKPVTTTCQGVIRGRTIELREAIDLPDGQEVRVTVAAVGDRQEGLSKESLERLKRAAGAWAEDAEELDAFLEWNRQQRRLERRADLE